MKNIPYWLKGGIIAALFPPAVFVMDLLIDQAIGLPGEGGYFFNLISAPVMPVFNALFRPSIPYTVTYLIFFLASCALYFIIGAAIGWIVGKSKK